MNLTGKFLFCFFENLDFKLTAENGLKTGKQIFGILWINEV